MAADQPGTLDTARVPAARPARNAEQSAARGRAGGRVPGDGRQLRCDPAVSRLRCVQMAGGGRVGARAGPRRGAGGRGRRGDRRGGRRAVRAADRVDAEFGPGGRDGIDGHPCVEMALVELTWVTGQPRYAALADRMLGLRGKGLRGAGRYGAEYWQDHEPVRTARRGRAAVFANRGTTAPAARP